MNEWVFNGEKWVQCWSHGTFTRDSRSGMLHYTPAEMMDRSHGSGVLTPEKMAEAIRKKMAGYLSELEVIRDEGAQVIEDHPRATEWRDEIFGTDVTAQGQDVAAKGEVLDL